MLTTYIRLETEVKNERSRTSAPFIYLHGVGRDFTFTVPLFKHVVCTGKNRLNNYDIRYLHFVSTVERNSVGKACECNTDAYPFKNTVSSAMN